MPRYEQVMPGVYQIIPDENADVEAAQLRIENFRKRLIAQYEEFYQGSHGKKSPRKVLSTK